MTHRCIFHPHLEIPHTDIAIMHRAMLSFLSAAHSLSLLLLVASAFLFLAATRANFISDVDITWGTDHVAVINQGQEIHLSLDSVSGSGFRSKQEFFYGKFDVKIRLVPGNSAGTVATFYLGGSSWSRDEIDMEFLGNLSGQPYTLHTNIYTQGKGDREQQFYLWFDPTKDFHTYSILWNPHMIMLYVDSVPVRVYKNRESLGIPYPNKQAMKVYSSIWSADWATRGGLVKTDWAQAPFTAALRDLAIDGCVSMGSSAPTCTNKTSSWMDEDLQLYQEKLAWVQKNYMVYNYCNDAKRFPQGFPTECSFGLQT